MEQIKTLNIAINNLSRELSAVLHKNNYEVNIIPSNKIFASENHYKSILKDLEFHLKEYKILAGKEHKLQKNIFEFYEGMWYLKNEGII